MPASAKCRLLESLRLPELPVGQERLQPAQRLGQSGYRAHPRDEPDLVDHCRQLGLNLRPFLWLSDVLPEQQELFRQPLEQAGRQLQGQLERGRRLELRLV